MIEKSVEQNNLEPNNCEREQKAENQRPSCGTTLGETGPETCQPLHGHREQKVLLNTHSWPRTSFSPGYLTVLQNLL